MFKKLKREFGGYWKDVGERAEHRRKEEEKKPKSERLLEKQIREVKRRCGPWVMAILGVVGLFFFIVPGIICFIISAIWYHSKRNKIHELELRLTQLKERSTKSKKLEYNLSK